MDSVTPLGPALIQALNEANNPIQTLLADPPWSHSDQLPGPGRGAGKHYELLTLDVIKNFELPPLADDCRLFLWRVASLQEEALEVMHAWGFTPKAEIVWRKKTKNGKRWFGMGRQVRMEHEVCLIGTRGSPPQLDKSIRSTFSAKANTHSSKPVSFYRIIEKLSPGPYGELFARAKRKGWQQWGNELTDLENV